MTASRFALLVAALAWLLPTSLRAADEAKDKEKARKTVTVAHLKLSGSMDEKAPMVDPLLGQVGETFKQKIDRLKKARDDKDVSAVLLEIDGLAVGFGKLHELSRAVASIRAAGKKVYAYTESGNRGDYLLALAAEEICLPEPSWLMLNGIRMEATFYKGLLEKLGVKADFVQMGDFKAAAEPYIRDNLSDANRQQLTAILDDFYSHEIVGRIAKARKLDKKKVEKLIDEGPYSGRAALKAGLVDRLASLTEFEEAIKKKTQGDEVKLVRDYGKKKDTEDINVFDLYRKLLFGPSRLFSSKAPKVAVIFANGPIMTGKSASGLFAGETVGSSTLVKAIQEAEDDKSVKAIVLRVDSPGGSAVASDLIWSALKKCKKPVIASMSDVAGSGGYYICMSAKKIYAEPGTITGSIGVIGGKMALRGLYDKVGIKTEVLARGKNSGLLGSDPFSPSEKQAFKAMMQDVYDEFVRKAHEGRVAAGKKLALDEVLKLAGGRIYTGRQAKANGLIDEVGTLEDAIAAAAKLGGLPADKEPELLQLPKAKNSLGELLGSAFGAHMSLDLKAIQAVPELAEKFRGVDALLRLRKEPVWAIEPFRIEVK